MHSCSLVAMGTAIGTIANGHDGVCRHLCRHRRLHAGQWTACQAFRMGKSVLRFRLVNQGGWGLNSNDSHDLPLLFYVGTIGCVWFLFWILIVREGPEKDQHISKDELQYIQSALGVTKKPDIKHPWKDIFTSKAVYAISASHFAENWGFYTLLTQLPTFLKGNNRTNRFEERRLMIV